VPISPEQDTAGPIALTVRDAAAVLTAIAGSDRADPATASADAHKADYVADLDAKALKGARIGVVRGWVKGPPAEEQVFAAALTRLRAAGAVLVEVPLPPAERRRMLDDAETTALEGEFHTALDAYLASTPAAVKTRSLTDLIAFDKATPAEMALFGQDIFEDSAKLDAKAVASARALAHQIAGPEGLDRMFAAAQVEAIVSETESPAAVVDPVDGTNYLGSASTLPAVAGYPHLTVPMGQVAGLPVGLSFIGPAWSDARILALGYAYEQASHAARPPTFPLTITLKAAAAQP
jgi:amidase